MISISRQYRFEAAHHLPFVPEGHKCRKLHGHTYRVAVTFRGDGPHGGLDDRGFVRDFAEVDAVVEPLLKLLDHTCLNDTMGNPTAEMIAIYIAAGIPGCHSVRVYENDDCWAEFTNTRDQRNTVLRK